MILLALIQAATVLAVVVTSPVAPWWAGPEYVTAAAHVVETLGSALIVALGTASVQVYYARDARKDRLAKRLESHVEHGKGIEEAKVREVALAAKVDATALHMADKVEATTATIVGKLDHNTALTTEAAAASKEAAAVANNVNEKIANTNERITEAINAGKT